MTITNEWIVDRAPTQDDADLRGDIQVKVSPYFGVAATYHWSQVDSSQPWRHTRYWNPQQADRIAALGWFEAELSPSAALAALEYMQLLDRMTLARTNATPLQHESLRDRPMTTANGPCRTLSKDLRNENGGDHYGFVAISRPWQIDDGCSIAIAAIVNYRYGVSVERFLSEPENFGGTWLIDGGWGDPPGPIRVDWLDSESRWQCRGYSAECRDPFLSALTQSKPLA